jgi:endoglucanase
MQRILTSRGLLRRWLTLWLEDRRRARAATHSGPTVPNSPANLTGTDMVTYIQLNWQDMSSDEIGFRVYRKVDAGAFGLYQTFGPNVVSYQDSAVVISHWYYYFITAYNAVGESAPSNQVSVQAGSS